MDYIQTPSYKVVRDGIVNDILGGVYGKDGLLKGQEYYARRFGVCRTTVRKAIDDLVKRKVLYTIKGKGTYVYDAHVKRQLGDRTLSFSVVERVKGQHKNLTSVVYSLEAIIPDDYIGRQLQLAEGDRAIRIKRLRQINGVPENYQISFLSAAKVSMIDFAAEDLENGSLFELLETKAGLTPMYSEEEIRAVRCLPEIARALDIASDDPVLFIKRTTYDKDDHPMEYCEDYECTDVKGLKIRNYSK